MSDFLASSDRRPRFLIAKHTSASFRAACCGVALVGVVRTFTASQDILLPCLLISAVSLLVVIYQMNGALSRGRAIMRMSSAAGRPISDQELSRYGAKECDALYRELKQGASSK